MLLLIAPAGAQTQDSSPQDAQRAWSLARDLWAPVELQANGFTAGPLGPAQADLRLRQACLLLEAAVQLDPQYELAWKDLIFLLTSDSLDDPGRAANAVFQYYTLNPQNARPISHFLRYRLQKLEDRRSREYFLLQSIPTLTDYPYLQSEAYAQLGTLTLEKGDINSARLFFHQAFNHSSFNEEALTRLLQLPWPQVTEDMPNMTAELVVAQNQKLNQEKVTYEILLRRLRVRNNPFDLDAVLELIDILEWYGYPQLAGDFYDHAQTILATDSPADVSVAEKRRALGRHLRFRQLVNAYSTEADAKAVDIAQTILEGKFDDLLVVGILSSALRQLNPQAQSQADQWLKNAGEAAIRRLAQPDGDTTLEAYQLHKELIWFFCFFDPDPIRALHYAQTLPADAPPARHANLTGAAVVANPQRTRALVAYAYALNDQWQKVRESLAQTDPNDPLAALAEAKILIQQNQPDAALNRLQAVNPAQAGILAKPIRNLLERLSPEAAAPVPGGSDADAAFQATLQPSLPAAAETAGAAAAAAPTPAPEDPLLATWRSQFTNNELEMVRAPEKFLRCSLHLSSDIFSFGMDIYGKIILANTSDIHDLDTPIVLGPRSVLGPSVLITAEVTPLPGQYADTPREFALACGDLSQRPILYPGKSNTVEETLSIGLLREILESCPRQTFQVTFRLYLDPVADGRGGYRSRIPALQPAPVTITRRAFTPAPRRMVELTRAIQQDTIWEQYQATHTFAALWRDLTTAPSGQGIPSINTRLMRELIRKNLTHDDFRIRAWSAHFLHEFMPTLEPSEAAALSGMLNDDHWFARFMALRALFGSIDLTEYFQWSASIEEHPLIGRQIDLYQDKPWQIQPLPFEVPESFQSSVPAATQP